MATTKYTVFVNDEALEGTLSKKDKAIDLAKAQRDELKATVRVETGSGTVVFEQAAPKKINMSPKYTRVVSLPEGVEVPDGMRVAYHFTRRNVAILHDGEDYRLLDTTNSELGEETFATTREAGNFARA